MTVSDDGEHAGGTGFRSVTPWSPGAAVAAVILVVLAAMGSAAAAGVVFYSVQRLTPGPGLPSVVTQSTMMVGMLLMQGVIVALVVWLAGWYGGHGRRVLSLGKPLTPRMFIFGLSGMAAILLPYNLAAYLIWPSDFLTDLRPFAELARSPAAPIAALVVAVGAPFSEELLFRGFLLPALAPARPRTFVSLALIALIGQMVVPVIYGELAPAIHMGHAAMIAAGAQSAAVSGAGIAFSINLALLITAAAAWLQTSRRVPAGTERSTVSGAIETSSFALATIFTTAGWTLMHLGYSLIGLSEVFMIGLYFCWLMWRFGNLWLTISLHAFYNGMQMLVLMMVPLPAPA